MPSVRIVVVRVSLTEQSVSFVEQASVTATDPNGSFICDKLRPGRFSYHINPSAKRENESLIPLAPFYCNMNAEESDRITPERARGLYPNGLTHVLVLAKRKGSDTYKWTSGRPTGNISSDSEHFEVVTDSPLVESKTGYYHKEDIKDPDKYQVSELNA